MVLINPQDYHRTVDILTQSLTENGWQVTNFGYEFLPDYIKSALQSKYNITSLYLRTKPDLLATRDSRFNDFETFLIEAKDLTEKATQTGNLAVEALPWFIARHLLKINVNYLYAIESPESNVYLIKPDLTPFSDISTIYLPNLHKEYFAKNVLSGLKSAFPKIIFNLIQMQVKSGFSQDPYLLVPFSLIAKYGRELNQFAKWGWKN